MSINKQTEIISDLQIGPTSEGMVRIYIASQDYEIPMDFEPDAAIEIAQDLIAAAEAARAHTRS